MSSQGVTIIICCFNSEERLPDTLKHIAVQQHVEPEKIEVLLVDNRCTDRTVEIFEHWTQNLGPGFVTKIVRETTPGLLSARICGLNHASNETLIFCDDDNWLYPSYCRRALQIFNEHASVGVAGGCSIAVTEIEPPKWFAGISGGWAIGQSDYIGYLQGPEAFIRGAGIVIRRTLFLQLLESGYEFIASGRKGSILSAGEDAEICAELQRMGARLWYDSHLKLQHWIPKQRLNRKYALQLWRGFGGATIVGDADRIASRPNERFRNMIRSLWWYQIIRGTLNLLLRIHQHPLLYPSDPTPSLGYCSVAGRLLVIWNMGSEYGRRVRRKVDWLLHNKLTYTPVQKS